MYGKDYYSRLTVQQIVSFFLRGAENGEDEEGTPEERYRQHSKAFTVGLRKFKDRVLSTDWDAIEDESKRLIKTEDLYQEALIESGDTWELAYEMGLRAGFMIAQELYNLSS